MFTLGAITLGVFFLRFVVFNFKESPKFLVYRGQDDKAIEVLEYIAKFNKRECGVDHSAFDALTNEHSSMESGTELIGTGAKQLKLSMFEQVKFECVRYKMLFSGWQMTRLTVLVWLTYIMDFWGFTLAGKDLHLLRSDRSTNKLPRHIPSYSARTKEWRHQSVSRIHLPKLHLHLPSWHRRCHFGNAHVRRASDWPQIRHDDILWAHGS